MNVKDTKQVLFDGIYGTSSNAIQRENGDWLIINKETNQTSIVDDITFQTSQNKVGEEMWSAWENADMSELDEEDDYDYINNFVKVADGR